MRILIVHSFPGCVAPEITKTLTLSFVKRTPYPIKKGGVAFRNSSFERFAQIAFVNLLQNATFLLSSLSRGTWIEIHFGMDNRTHEGGRPSHEGRGLK